MTRTPLISRFLFVALCLIPLLLSGCDNPNEKVEEIAPIEGALLTNGPVPAITPEGAQKISDMIMNLSFVSQYKEMMNEIMEDDKVREDFEENFESMGTFNVIPRADHYEVIFPKKTRITSKDSGDEIIKNVEISHDIQLKVTPTGDPSAYYVTYVVTGNPLVVTLNTADNSYDVLTVSYNAGAPVKTLWHNDFQTFTQITGSQRDVQININIPEEFRKKFDGIDAFTISISNIVHNVMLTPDANNLWSGPMNISLGNILVDLPQDVGALTILSSELKSNTEKLNPVIYKEFWEAYSNFMTEMRTASETNNSDQITNDLVSFVKVYKNLLLNGFKGGDFSFVMKDISTDLNSTPIEQPDAIKNFSLGEFSVNSSFKRQENEAVDLAFSYGFRGLDVGLYQFREEFGGEAPQELLPQNINLGFGIRNFPLRPILEKTETLLNDSGDDIGAFTKSMTMAQNDFISLITQAGTEFQISDSYVGNDIWLLLANGTGSLNPSSPVFLQGETDIRFYGLDLLMQALDQRLKNPETSPLLQSNLQQVSMGLGMMQMFGQQKQDDKGRGYRGYFLTATPEGQIQLNGTDLSQMMGMMQ